MTDAAELEQIAREIRFKCVEMSHRGQAPHLGSALSCVDILVSLYFGGGLRDYPVIPLRDRFIFSKGHAASALYATLAKAVILDDGELDTYAKDGSRLTEHPNMSIPGVEWATGSLGHGLSVGVGMALSAKMRNQNHRVLTLLSDGECQEGSVWEAAMFASAHGLDNVVAIIDFNRWQATGRSVDVMAPESLAKKWEAFGWRVCEGDGNIIHPLVRVLNKNSDSRPRVIIAHTVKGRGVSFMEDDNNWHYRIPTAEEVEQARKELLE